MTIVLNKAWFNKVRWNPRTENQTIAIKFAERKLALMNSENKLIDEISIEGSSFRMTLQVIINMNNRRRCFFDRLAP